MSGGTQPAPAEAREAGWRALGETAFDLLVIGGGITGSGVARDAARRGLSVALVERGDLASGTSSRSSRLVHGGLRYLEQFAFGLVFEAVSERRVLQEIAPHLVRPLGFLFPIYRDSRRGRLTVELGMWLYEALSLFRSPRRHRSYNASQLEEIEPALRRDELTGATLYWDCATDDARLTLETALDAAEVGARILTYVEALGLEREGGRVVGARVRDRLTGRERTVRAGVVVNATGPWTDRVRESDTPLLRPTKGVHIVVEHERLPLHYADVLQHPEDGRVMFAIPWGERSYVGTTDTFYDGDPDEVAACAEDVRYLLAALRHHYRCEPLGEADVISTWAGLRPLIREEGADPSSVSREHRVVVDPDGLVTIAGGKLTTYRRMAAETVDAAVGMLRLLGGMRRLEPARTDEIPLPGARGWPEGDDTAQLEARVRAASGEQIDERDAARLVRTYGVRAEQVAERVRRDPALARPLSPCGPERWAEFAWAVEAERAQRVMDVLRRRLTVALTHREQGLDCCEEAARRMGEWLGWDRARVREEIELYEAEIARSRAWRGGGPCEGA
ncbi:MAG: glycerol-3-phosphate dehydrogenase [Planctomycetota bacterium]|nr:MAG: glycerol-3-phosphate dehydrogenase [Planctomycetota bacterium]